MKMFLVRHIYILYALSALILIVAVFALVRTDKAQHYFSDDVESSSPIIFLTRQTSDVLKFTDQLFKDLLKEDDSRDKDQMPQQLAQIKHSYADKLTTLEHMAKGKSELEPLMVELRRMEKNYFEEVDRAIENYLTSLNAREEVKKSSDLLQNLRSELELVVKKHLDDPSSSNTSTKVMSVSYFIKLDDTNKATFRALNSQNKEQVAKAIADNRKTVVHLNYIYRGLAAENPEIKKELDDSVRMYSSKLGKNGVLHRHNAYLVAKDDLQANIANLTQQLNEKMALLNSLSETADFLDQEAL